MKNKVLSTKEAAAILGCGERTVRDMIKRGSIHARKIDPTTKSVYQISADEVERIIRLRDRGKGNTNK